MCRVIITENFEFDNLIKKPLALVRNGILCEVERQIIKNPNALIHNNLFDEINYCYMKHKYSSCMCQTTKSSHVILKDREYFPWTIIRNANSYILSDYNLLEERKLLTKVQKSILNNSIILGDSNLIQIRGKGATIYPGVCFNTMKGPIVIGDSCEIYPFSIIEGPIYIGDYSIVKSAKLYGGTIIGRNCKISGEIINSIIGDYTNKAHDGLVSESYIGDWCNIGGFTSTASLKMDYSQISVKVKSKIYDTGMFKLGDIIGNYVRINGGIGILPGTFIDTCSTIIEFPYLRGYLEPFTKIAKIKLSFEAFLEGMKTMMERRNILIDSDLIEYWRKIYEITTK